MNATHLCGLNGTNPLSFFAALGVQVVFANQNHQPHLWWSNDTVPHAIVDEEFSVDRIAQRALEAFSYWNASVALNPIREDGSSIPGSDTLKLAREDIRVYLHQATRCDWSGCLATSLVAEGSLDNQEIAKPSDFYFTAGQQKFLKMARDILQVTKRDEVVDGLTGPWTYKSKEPSLGWDVTDDPVYALRASDPSDDTKLTNPGIEALSLLGLSLYPVYASPDRTLTQGCSGKWKNGSFSWPLWQKPATPRAVKSLLAHAYYQPATSNRDQWYCAWGVFNIFRSQIRRTDQGGYGTFGPPESMF